MIANTTMPPAAEVSSPLEAASIYTREFWLAYAANLALVTANSLTFRFADYVAFFGGTKTLTGWIVQSGLVAAILFRLVLGRAIDRYGPRRVWLTSSSLLFLGCAAHLGATTVSPWLWIARIAQQLGIAGMFTCSIVNIQDQVPPQRRTEVIGSLGSSGFLGTILGTNLGDLIFQVWPNGQLPFLITFGSTLLGGILHTLLVLELTRQERHEAPPHFIGPLKLLLHYWPGPVLLVSMAMGTSFAVTTVFLSRYVSAAGLGGIAPFFLPYSITAFTCRWYLRDWGTRVGRHKMVLWGLAGLTLGQLLFLPVRSNLWLCLPGAVCGFGHALLFPAVVSLGSGRFPVAYRGTGTTLILGFQEVGLALSAPLLGMLIDWGNQWPVEETLGARTGELAHAGTWGFLAMFVASALSAGLTALFYAGTAARHPDRDPVLGPVQAMMNPQPDEN